MKENTTGIVGSSLSWVLSITQTNEIFQLIQIIFSILVSLVTLCFILWKWYQKATDDDSDGGTKITKKEIDDLTKEVKDHVSGTKRKDL